MGWPLLMGEWPNAVQRQRQEEGPGQIVLLFDQGKKVGEIGRALGLHHLAVYRKLVKAGRVPHKR